MIGYKQKGKTKNVRIVKIWYINGDEGNFIVGQCADESGRVVVSFEQFVVRAETL